MKAEHLAAAVTMDCINVKIFKNLSHKKRRLKRPRIKIFVPGKQVTLPARLASRVSILFPRYQDDD